MARKKQTARKSTGGSWPRALYNPYRALLKPKPSTTAGAAAAAPTDIETSLRRVLKTDLDFKGEFAFGRAYPAAPNPCIELDDVGLVGLPLSPAVARSVIDKCRQAPFGKGERTVVDTEVRDTWEMDAGQVRFLNAAWGPWMDGVVREVCHTLGVNFEASKPRAELYKLLVYETGSHFLPHVDTEKANGMFASIVVVLPSAFTGGDAHTSHSGTKSVLNSSDNSMFQTKVLAWYTDVTHEIKPITSGYRFALTYNLVHTTTAIRPALSSTNAAVAQLRELFATWNANKDGPEKVFYLLDHHYSNANLSGSALKGSDAHIVAILDSLAKEVGFGLGLLNAELHQSGGADDEGHGYYGRNRWGYGDSDEEEDNNDDVGFMEIESSETTIHEFVDPDGNPLDHTALDEDDDNELAEALEETGDYEQEYEGYMGNGAGSLDRFYRSTLLVIWPRWSDICGSGGDRRAVGALERLETLTSDAPTPGELEDFHYLTSVVQDLTDEDQSTAVERLFGAAILWHDPALWTEAVSKCCAPDMSLDAVTVDDLHDARATFKFAVMAESLRPVILENNSNERLQFVQNLRALKEDGESTDGPEIDSFVEEMRNEVLDNMRPYTSAGELQSFSKEVLAEGGVQMLRDRLLPQIQKFTSKETVSAFEAYLDWLHNEWTTSASPVTEAESSLRKGFITTLLDLLVPLKSLFITKAGGQGDASAAVALATKCINYGNPHLAVTVVDSIAAEAKRRADEAVAAKAQAAPIAPVVAPAYPRYYNSVAAQRDPAELAILNRSKTASEAAALVPGVVFPFVRATAPAFKNCNPPLDVGAQFCAMAETAMKVGLSDLKTVRRDELASMLEGTKGLDNSATLLTTIISTLKSLPWSEENWVACMEEFSARRKDDEATFGPAILDMAQVYAEKVNLPTAVNNYGYGYGWPAGPPAGAYVKALQLALRTGGLATFSHIVRRIVRPPPATYTSGYVTSVLVPLIPELKQIATTNQLPLATPAFAQAFKGIVAAWIDKDLGQKPNLERVKQFSEKLKRYACRCTHCAQVVRFLQSGEQQTLQLSRIGAPSVKHVSREVVACVLGDVTCQVRRSSPQGLDVTKSAELVRAAKWSGLLTQGRNLLSSVGSDAEVRHIWGNEYATALGPLLTKEQRVLAPNNPGVVVPPPPPAPVASGSNSGPVAVKRKAPDVASAGAPPKKKPTITRTTEVIDISDSD
ncbi:hypothetical protein MKEN_00135500 [Mycena kentingensis (nom. inval.)]|nr:hypothetical protein MKEN_00135500 [Mycena kentingensis (nom. inval.)]